MIDAEKMNTLTYEETDELQHNPVLVFVHGVDRFDAEYIGYRDDGEMEFRLVKRAR